MASIEEKVESIIKEPIKNLGYDLYDVNYVKEGKDYFLRIFIDNKEGIDLNDCEKVNDAISDLLDEANYIKEQYFLEVSSPGIERIIRKDEHLKQNIGEQIYVKLFMALNGKKEYIGILKRYDSNTVEIEEQELIRNR
ncbi:MAG: ribosome maturation factor RimP [Clostridia bacterium]|nr:ribosome maturation factor RimP [Clostridia bacterium]